MNEYTMEKKAIEKMNFFYKQNNINVFEFENNKKTLELWKKFAKEKIIHHKKEYDKEENYKKGNNKEKSGKEKNDKEENDKAENDEGVNNEEQTGKEQTGKEQTGKEQNGKELNDKENENFIKWFSNFDHDFINWKNSHKKNNNEKTINEQEELLLYKKKLIEENYFDEYEKYIGQLNNDFKKNLKESSNELCVIEYKNFINRNVQINTEYVKNVSHDKFFNFFYSSLCFLKENKLIIPKGFYLYELIYPQTNNCFPVINKLHYYFVKLFINNTWVLVFVDLFTPLDDKREKRVTSFFPLNQKELWIFIIQKALYICFQKWNFLYPHLYITEILTGLKFIKTTYNDRRIKQNEINNYIQCFILSKQKDCKNNIAYRKKNYYKKNNQNDGTDQNNSIVNTITKRKERVRKQKIQKTQKIQKKKSTKFLFLICSVENEYIGVKCNNTQPRNSIIFEQSIYYKEKNKIPKGYKYLSEEGIIKVGTTQLVPITSSVNCLKNYPNQKKIDKKECNIKDNIQSEQNISNLIIINENTTKQFQLLKELMETETSRKKKKKIYQ